ncbi:MAG: hypothetical protein IPI23_11835 [Bacteroidetes bacterium]|nr:hypothetical protein [Bacteroidota bacterium]
MKNLLKFLSLLLIASTLSLFVISCGDDDDEPSPTPTPTATCSDGIQNQGETGIDCGGPCAACPTATLSNCWVILLTQPKLMVSYGKLM